MTTNQTSELYELCKEVYEKTGWEDTDFGFWEYKGLRTNEIEIIKTSALNKIKWSSPLYTSDYLLEKLPRSIINDSDDWTDDTFWLTLAAGVNNWHAYYELANHKERHWRLFSDTPLKALLKLCLALKEAGELNG